MMTKINQLHHKLKIHLQNLHKSFHLRLSMKREANIVNLTKGIKIIFGVEFHTKDGSNFRNSTRNFKTKAITLHQIHDRSKINFFINYLGQINDIYWLICNIRLSMNNLYQNEDEDLDVVISYISPPSNDSRDRIEHYQESNNQIT